MSKQQPDKAQPFKEPRPGHTITIGSNPNRVIVALAGRIVADTGDALTLREAECPAVDCIPRKVVDMTLLERSMHSSHCPYKGDGLISIFHSAARARSTPSGPTRIPTRPW